MVKISDFQNYLKSKKIDSWEVYLDESKSTSIEINKSDVEYILSGEKTGFGVRVAKNKKLGFSYTNDIKKFKECIDTAITISKLNNKDDDFESFAKTKKEYPKVKTYDKDLEHFDVKDFHEYMNEFRNIIEKQDKNIVTGNGVYRKNITNKNIINSEGIDIKEKSSSNSVFFDGLRLENGNENINLELGDADIGILNPNVANEFGKRLVSMKNKKDIATKKTSILFHPECFGAIMDEFINNSFSAENIQKNKSILCEKENKKMFDEKLSISDDATINGLYDSRVADDEGIPSQKTTLIEKGIVQNFIYDSYTSNKEKKESTGNASRTYFSKPSICTSNILIEEGRRKNLISEIDEGIYLKGLMGIHTMNHSTGDFSLSVYEGHNIKKGEIISPLKDTMISGNIINILNNIIGIGKGKGKYLWGEGSGYTPEILVSNVQVIGSK